MSTEQWERGLIERAVPDVTLCLGLGFQLGNWRNPSTAPVVHAGSRIADHR